MHPTVSPRYLKTAPIHSESLRDPLGVHSASIQSPLGPHSETTRDLIRTAQADVTQVVWDAASDDTAWLPIRELLQQRWFDAALVELPGNTWGAGAGSSRSNERPQGVKGIRPEVKETLWLANHQVRRAAEVAESLRSVGGAWAVGGPPDIHGVQPWQLPEWQDIGPSSVAGRFRGEAAGWLNGLSKE